MGKIEDLASNYERHLSAPWPHSVSGAQRVMLLIYDKELERTCRARLKEFEIITKRASYGWIEYDCTKSFSSWLASDEYHEAYFESPEDLSMKIEGEFKKIIIQSLQECLRSADAKTVVAITGVASLYGFAHISEIVRAVEPDILGRLIVFFPGTKDGNNYRLLDARDGWNYLANSITSHATGGIV